MHSLSDAENLETRVTILRFVIRMLRHLVQLNNFNGALQITSAFSGSALFRLKATMEQLTEYFTLFMNYVKSGGSLLLL